MMTARTSSWRPRARCSSSLAPRRTSLAWKRRRSAPEPASASGLSARELEVLRSSGDRQDQSRHRR